MTVTHSINGRGTKCKIAYEDIRLAPSSSVLQELDVLGRADDNWDVPNGLESGIFNGPNTPETISSYMAGEYSIFIHHHPIHVSVIVNTSSTSIGERISKDIGDVSLPKNLTEAQFSKLRSIEQKLLKDGYEVVGSSNVSRKEVQFLSDWMI